ncbi:MAG: ABC transporter ATP-binding protein [Chloroflexi bacterium]|nr:ABC transporter ATP-binding protein [Chloroflexota bacterium]
MAEVALEHVTKRFAGGAAAVDDLTLNIHDGELMVLLGPSGCGKTTGLRMVAGLEHPDLGDISIGGRRVNDLEPKDRDVALVFQSYALYPHMTARGNMLYPLKVRPMSQAERERRVAQAADLLRITHLLDRKPRQLSGGEQQRVALGRAIVREPQVFLMDEPLSNLDAKLRVHTRAELKALQMELGTTTVFVTHDQAEAMTMADRIAVMDHGALQQVGTPDEVYDRPANLFVAQFMGSPPMNTLAVTLDGMRLVADGGWSFPLARGISAPDGQLTLGVRPEDVSVNLQPTDGGQLATVFVSEPLGNEVIVNAHVGETLLKVRAQPSVRPAHGETVYLVADPARLHVFGADGRRLND